MTAYGGACGTSLPTDTVSSLGSWDPITNQLWPSDSKTDRLAAEWSWPPFFFLIRTPWHAANPQPGAHPPESQAGISAPHTTHKNMRAYLNTLSHLPKNEYVYGRENMSRSRWTANWDDKRKSFHNNSIKAYFQDHDSIFYDRVYGVFSQTCDFLSLSNTKWEILVHWIEVISLFLIPSVLNTDYCNRVIFTVWQILLCILK